MVPERESARLASLVDNLNQAALMETPDRRVARTNRAFCQMFAVPAPPEALVGGDCVEAARSLAPLLGDVDVFLARVDELIADWQTVTAERITLTDGRLLERDFLPITHVDGTREIAWVYRDVTEWEQLRAAAEASAQQNAELLSAISHDVRTPVTGIVGLVELLQRQPIDARTRQIVESVRQSAAGLTTMLDDFLDAARADAGLLEVEVAPVRPEALLAAVTDMVGPLARVKGLLLVAGASPQSPEWVDLDAGRVRQILLNLVSNAVKFTAAGTVTLTADVAGDDIVFTCTDTGPGLGSQPPDEVFRAFVRGSAGGTGATRGAGLGLAIASKLATVMGGSLRVTDTGPQGSTFVLRLPLVRSDREQEPPAPLRGWRLQVLGPDPARDIVAGTLARAGAQIVTNAGEVAVVVTQELPAGAVPGVARTVVLAPVEPYRVPVDTHDLVATPVTAAGLVAAVLGVGADHPPGSELTALPADTQVLVVEDDTTNRVLITRMLEVLGVRPTAVADGVAALEAVAADSYDAVLMDIHLPGLDGVETTGLIRQRRGETATGRLPVVAMTGSSGWTDPQTMLDAGFDATLSKPMTLAELHACLESQLSRRSAGTVPAQDPPQPSSGERSAGGALDPGVLADLCGDVGDEELVRQTVRTYLAELPQRLATLADAVTGADQRTVKETAHSLKSASAMLGAAPMARLCADLETAAAADRAGPADLAAVLAESDRVSAAMTAYLA